MRAYIIVDLGFGDAGKGLLTDFLARHLKADVVVRYNGGAQAGHNVVTPDGRHHTFSQFGAGTFVPGVRTFLSRQVVIHPQALLVEGDILAGKGVRDAFSRLRISEEALVITPFHQAANRIRENVRGANRHGSCGVGVGEAVEDAHLLPELSIQAADLSRPAILRRKLEAIREYKREQLESLYKDQLTGSSIVREFEIFQRMDVFEQWISSAARIAGLGLVVSDSVLEGWLYESRNVIFEGAQGVLLDADAGFHPYTTWSRCTAENAIELIKQMAPEANIHHLGVIRCFAVRHGPGPLPTETDSLQPLIGEHNRHNPWQGTVRYGWLDAVLARYALAVTGGVDALVVTHLDLLSHLIEWKYCPGYESHPELQDSVINMHFTNGLVKNFKLPDYLPLEQRSKFTGALSDFKPMIEACSTNEHTVINQIESLLEYPVGMISHGPTAKNVQVMRTLAT